MTCAMRANKSVRLLHYLAASAGHFLFMSTFMVKKGPNPVSQEGRILQKQFGEWIWISEKRPAFSESSNIL